MEGLTVHVITNGDPTRLAATTAALDTYKLSYVFHHFEKHPVDGRLGCYLSHIALFNHAKKHNMEYIAIAEDNLKSTGDTISPEIREFITKSEWDILYLGGFTFPFDRYSTTSFPSIFNTSLAHGTSFYIMHRRLYEKVLELHSPHSEDHIDMFIQRVSEHPYVVYPLLFHRDGALPTTVRYSVIPMINKSIGHLLNVIRNSFIIRLMEDLAYYWIYVYLTVTIYVIFIILRLFNMKGMPVSASNATTPGRPSIILSAAPRAFY